MNILDLPLEMIQEAVKYVDFEELLALRKVDLQLFIRKKNVTFSFSKASWYVSRFVE